MKKSREPKAMAEVHHWRFQLERETRSMSNKERVIYINQAGEVMARQLGLKVQHPLKKVA